MPKRNTNRAYKRGEPHRDARLFIVVAEGEREDVYFSWFDQKSQRIKVQMVPRENQASAPKHFLKRLEQYLDENNIQDGDSIWFVLDVDRWERSSIDILIQHCNSHPEHHVAISNPCFKVWLNQHAGSIEDRTLNCDALKTILGQRIRGGFHPNRVCPMISQAIVYAEKADDHPDQDYPDVMCTKVYRLAKSMLAVLGNNWKM